MLRALRIGPRRLGNREWYTAIRRVWAPSTSSATVMSAILKPTCGRAAAMFSILAAITGFSLTFPPVSGSVGADAVLVADGIAVGADGSAEVELRATGWEVGRLSATPAPMPPATTRTAVAAMAAMRTRLMNRWA